jgi:hypothetical protein
MAPERDRGKMEGKATPGETEGEAAGRKNERHAAAVGVYRAVLHSFTLRSGNLPRARLGTIGKGSCFTARPEGIKTWKLRINQDKIFYYKGVWVDVA